MYGAEEHTCCNRANSSQDQTVSGRAVIAHKRRQFEVEQAHKKRQVVVEQVYCGSWEETVCSRADKAHKKRYCSL
jgi:hypothetical protein